MAHLNDMEFKSGQDLANDRNMMALGVIKRAMTKEEKLRAKEAAGDENANIPKFIADAPWYVSDGGVKNLKHQKHGVYGYDQYGMNPSEWYARGQRAGPSATKYRKGACENCGAMTHKAKECLERPRKLGAKYSGQDIQADEMIRNFDQSFEGKRDRWNGYDSREFARNMEEYERLEETRKAMKEAQKKAGVLEEEDFSDDEDRYEVEPDTPGQQTVDAYTRTSTRNLRIREDVAKYLLTNKNAAHYDPKSRSMRELPDGNQTDDPKLQNGKQEFVRAATGDAAKFEQLQRFAWQAERMGGDIHLQANPTQGEIRHRKVQEETEKKKAALRSSVLDRYGGIEHLAAPPKELLKSSEQFVEYTKMGEVIKGKEEPKTNSRYAEDGTFQINIANILVYLNNHTSVYGSWFRNGRWGYACCHQFPRNSYCTGKAGIEADEAAQRLARGEIEDTTRSPVPKKEAPKPVVDSAAIRDAIKEGTKRKRPDDSGFQFEDKGMSAADKSMISEEEYEEWRRNKMARSDDPLYAMKSMERGV